MGGRKSARGEKEARSQEPGAKGPGEGTPPLPPSRESYYCTKQTICMEKTSRCKEQGQQQEREHGQTGADAEQPLSLSQPNREELSSQSGRWGSGRVWQCGLDSCPQRLRTSSNRARTVSRYSCTYCSSEATRDPTPHRTCTSSCTRLCISLLLSLSLSFLSLCMVC